MKGTEVAPISVGGCPHLLSACLSPHPTSLMALECLGVSVLLVDLASLDELGLAKGRAVT